MSNEECERKYGFRRATDTFNRLYTAFEDETVNKPNIEVEKEYGETMYMKEEEKDISFLNRYYIFKKVNNIDALRLTTALLEGVSYNGEINMMEEQHRREKISDIKQIIANEPYQFEETKEAQEAKEAKQGKPKS